MISNPTNPTEEDFNVIKHSYSLATADTAFFADGKWVQRVVSVGTFAYFNPQVDTLHCHWDGNRLQALMRDTAITLVDFTWSKGQEVRLPVWPSPDEPLVTDDPSWRKYVRDNALTGTVDSVYVRWFCGRQRRCILLAGLPDVMFPNPYGYSWGPEIIEGAGALSMLWPGLQGGYADLPPLNHCLYFFQEGDSPYSMDSILGWNLSWRAPDDTLKSAREFCPTGVSRNRERKAPTCSVQPNPSSDRVEIAFDAPFRRLEVYESQGHRVHAQGLHAGDRRLTLDVADWPADVYLLRLEGEGAALQTKLILR